MDHLNDFEAGEFSASAANKQYDKIPAGLYTAVVTEVTCKEEQKNNENVTSVNVEFTLDEGDYQKRKVWKTYYLKNSASPANKNFIKSQACTMAGVDSTNGNTPMTFVNAKGNRIKFDLSYSPNIQNPEKPWTNVLVKELIAPF